MRFGVSFCSTSAFFYLLCVRKHSSKNSLYSSSFIIICCEFWQTKRIFIYFTEFMGKFIALCPFQIHYIYVKSNLSEYHNMQIKLWILFWLFEHTQKQKEYASKYNRRDGTHYHNEFRAYFIIKIIMIIIGRKCEINANQFDKTTKWDRRIRCTWVTLELCSCSCSSRNSFRFNILPFCFVDEWLVAWVTKRRPMTFDIS